MGVGKESGRVCFGERAAELNDGSSCCFSGSYSSLPPQPCPRPWSHSAGVLVQVHCQEEELLLYSSSRICLAKIFSDWPAVWGSSCVLHPSPTHFISDTSQQNTAYPLRSELKKYVVRDWVMCIGCCDLKVFLPLLFLAVFPGLSLINPLLLILSCCLCPGKPTLTKRGNCSFSAFSKEQKLFSRSRSKCKLLALVTPTTRQKKQYKYV